MIQIKTHTNGEVLHEVDSDTLRNANLKRLAMKCADLKERDLRGAHFTRTQLQQADLRGADLRGAYMANVNLWMANLEDANLEGAVLIHADLRGANLKGANFSGANLEGCAGNACEMFSLQSDLWPVTWLKDLSAVQLGCFRHSWQEWMAFTDQEIDAMDSVALSWWKKWKPIITQCIEATV